MVQKAASKNKANLFYGSLINMLDEHDPLITLADAIGWSVIEKRVKEILQSFKRSSGEADTVDGRVIDVLKIFFQYKNPNIQSGILLPLPISMSSDTMKLFGKSFICL